MERIGRWWFALVLMSVAVEAPATQIFSKPYTELGSLTLLHFEPVEEPVRWVPIVYSGLTIFVLHELPSLPSEPTSFDRGNGADVDLDGVFDDVERYIAQGYMGAPDIRLALYKYAFSLKKVFESIASGSFNSSVMTEATNLLMVAQHCVEDAAISADEGKLFYQDVLLQALADINRTKDYLTITVSLLAVPPAIVAATN